MHRAHVIHLTPLKYHIVGRGLAPADQFAWQIGIAVNDKY